jgi:hypothetical protein
VQRFLIIVACVPITPIVLGAVALYRRVAKKRSSAEVVVAPVLPAVE